MRRPAWAAAGSFASAWAWAEQNDDVREASRLEDFSRRSALDVLSKARVITVDGDQAAVLPRPRSNDEAREIAQNLRLPFPNIYLSVPMDLEMSEGLTIRVEGAILSERGTIARGLKKGVYGIPDDRDGYVLGIQGDDPAPGLTIVPFGFGGWEAGSGISVFMGACVAGDDAWETASPYAHSWAALFGGDIQAIAEGWQGMSLEASKAIVGVMSWMESVNVDLVETDLVPSRRRKAERKGQEIALTVRVRAPKTKGKSRGGSRRYSHRFEVAGHYMHFPEGTKIADADPTKLSFVPGRGFVRKVWCPPHVKGPEDKPLIPKVRVVEHAT